MTDTRFELRTFGSNCMLNHHLALIPLKTNPLISNKKKKKKKKKQEFFFIFGREI
jgi:hypothetical protein